MEHERMGSDFSFSCLGRLVGRRSGSDPHLLAREVAMPGQEASRTEATHATLPATVAS
jgi:hypothetical protein